MLLFEYKQRAWAAVSGLVLVAAIYIYFLAARGNPDWPAGGSLIGLWFGIAGSAMMVFAALLAVRRRFPTLRVGSGEFWLRAHLWIGTLSFLFILLHSGFRLGGPLEQWLWVSFATVVLSGFFLLFMQQILPNYLTARVPSETFAEQIPYLCRRLTVQSDEAVAGCYGPLSVDCEPVRDAIYDLANPARYGQAKSRQKEYVELARRIYGRAPTGPLERGFPIEEKEEEHADRPARGGAKASGGRQPPDSSAARPEVSQGAPPPPSAPEPGAEAVAAAPKAAATAAPKPAPGLSPIEIMRARQAAKNALAAADNATEPAASPTAVSTSAPAVAVPPATEKPLSKLELARAQMAAKKAGAAAPVESTPVTSPAAEAATGAIDKPLSKLELARAQMAAKQAAATAPDGVAAPAPVAAAVAPVPAAGEKPLSKLELARAQMLAKKGAAAATPAESPATTAVAPTPTENLPATPAAVPEPAAKPLSKIELMRAQAAAKKLASGDAPTVVKPVAVDASDVAASVKPPPPVNPTPAAARPSPGPSPAAKPAPAVARKTAAPEKLQLPLPRAEELLDFYLNAVRPFLEFDDSSFSGTGANSRRWKAALATTVQSEQTFINLRRTFPNELHAALDLLERCCNERRDYRLQQRIRRWLHGCLLLHIPASTALIVFFLIHVLTALRVIPF